MTRLQPLLDQIERVLAECDASAPQRLAEPEPAPSVEPVAVAEPSATQHRGRLRWWLGRRR